MSNSQDIELVPTATADLLPGSIAAALTAMGLKNSSRLAEQLPFVGDDVTVAVENEFFSSFYAVAIAIWFPIRAPVPQLALGFQAVWHPGVLLGLQGLGLAIVWFMGRSTVTAARLNFFVVREHV